jgi:uridine kinase
MAQGGLPRLSDVLAQRIRAAASGRIVVLLDGPAASGKTTLGSDLAYALGAQLVCMDTFYPGWGGLEVGSAMVHESVLDPDKPGWRRWDWKKGKAAEWHRVNGNRPVVIEGSGALSEANRARATFGIWIHLDAESRRKRKLLRDGTLNMEHWDRWAMQEQAFYRRERPDMRADVVIDGLTGLIID